MQGGAAEERTGRASQGKDCCEAQSKSFTSSRLCGKSYRPTWLNRSKLTGKASGSSQKRKRHCWLQQCTEAGATLLAAAVPTSGRDIVGCSSPQKRTRHCWLQQFPEADATLLAAAVPRSGRDIAGCSSSQKRTRHCWLQQFPEADATLLATAVP